MTPDPDLIGRLLLRIESDAHRRGWDAPAVLYVLYDADDHETDRAYREVMASRRGPAVRVASFTGSIREATYAAQSAVPESALAGSPAHALFRFALNVHGGGEHPTVEWVLGAMRQPGFLGLALLHEGWMQQVSPEERQAMGDVRFADIPGSIEVRNVMAVDIAGVDYFVVRHRGAKPELHRMDEAGGAIVESLRVIVARIAGLPVPELKNIPSGWDWEAERERAL